MNQPLDPLASQRHNNSGSELVESPSYHRLYIQTLLLYSKAFPSSLIMYYKFKNRDKARDRYKAEPYVIDGTGEFTSFRFRSLDY
jgi:hypothetical protein